MMYPGHKNKILTLVNLSGTTVGIMILSRFPPGYPQDTFAALSRGQVADIVTWMAAKNRSKPPVCSSAGLTEG